MLAVKGIVSDSNNIILWHESEDINKKRLFPKFQLILILRFQAMDDFERFIAPIDYCVEQSLMYETFLSKLLSFHTKMILACFLWGSVLLRGELQKYAKKSSFDNFESTRYSTSVSMPLKTIATMPSQTQNFLIFWLLILDSKNFQIIF